VSEVSADLRDLAGDLVRKYSPAAGGPSWQLKLDVCIQFGGTELTAFVEWVDQNVSFPRVIFRYGSMLIIRRCKACGIIPASLD
jgi:hypothetical protein